MKRKFSFNSTLGFQVGVLAAAAGLITSAAGAATIMMTNPGFEAGSLTGWTMTGSLSINSTGVPTGGGSYNADVYYSNDGAADGLAQLLSTSFQVGTYSVSVDVTNSGGTSPIVAIGDSTDLASYTQDSPLGLGFSNSGNGYGEALEASIIIGGSSPELGHAIEIGLGNSTSQFDGASGSGHIYFDNANLTYTPTPEPASLALLAVAGAGMLLKRVPRGKREN